MKEQKLEAKLKKKKKKDESEDETWALQHCLLWLFLVVQPREAAQCSLISEPQTGSSDLHEVTVGFSFTSQQYFLETRTRVNTPSVLFEAVQVNWLQSCRTFFSANFLVKSKEVKLCHCQWVNHILFSLPVCDLLPFCANFQGLAHNIMDLK